MSNPDSPLVSVVIPAYNHERYVGPAIESVLGQTCRDLEVIVIDDGSTDGTWRVIQPYLADPRVSAHTQANQDAYNTINRGLHLARGRFVAILNSDDLYAPRRLERLLEIQKAAGAECIFTDVQAMDAAGTPITEPRHHWNQWHEKNRRFYFECGDLYTAFLKGNFMVTTSNLFLTAGAVRKVGDFAPLRYLHDYDYIFRVMLACPGRVHYAQDEKLVFYRIHGSNTLGQGAITAREQDQAVIRKYMLARLPDAFQPLAQAGVDRLLELERELHVERNRLLGEGATSLRLRLAELLRRWGRDILAPRN
ncbi:MAG: glycosyltransferase [Lentisphaerae bacterium]|nr:glycosyltransferase [Lentisphaerota bacterium]